MTADEFHECIARAQARLRAMATIVPDGPVDVLGGAAMGLALIATPNLDGTAAARHILATQVYILSLLGIEVPLDEMQQFAAQMCGPAN